MDASIHDLHPNGYVGIKCQEGLLHAQYFSIVGHRVVSIYTDDGWVSLFLSKEQVMELHKKLDEFATALTLEDSCAANGKDEAKRR